MRTAKVDIVIPAAGLGRRMKSYGPKALVPVGPETLIARQIRLLSAAYPHARVVVVVGFEAERLRRALPPGVRVVVNRDYESTNVARSIELGLAATRKNSAALVVYGDLVFNQRAVESIPAAVSSVVVEDGAGRGGEVGVNVVGGMAVHFSYGLDTKWAQIVMLAPHEKRLFMAACRKPNAGRLFGYEVLNLVIDGGGEFLAVTHPSLRLVEVDASKDIERAGGIDAPTS